MDEIPTVVLGIMLLIVGLLMFVMMINCSGSAYSAGRRRSAEIETANALIKKMKASLNA
jgi:hypothetical protein